MSITSLRSIEYFTGSIKSYTEEELRDALSSAFNLYIPDLLEKKPQPLTDFFQQRLLYHIDKIGWAFMDKETLSLYKDWLLSKILELNGEFCLGNYWRDKEPFDKLPANYFFDDRQILDGWAKASGKN